MDLVERFRARYGFPLDDFQLEAIRAIQADQSVIVSAPTGAGKTLVAEFAIMAALERGVRIAYTTPLKALSNQKFGDFTRAYGEERVGILTGDVKVNPHAPVVVMTTEILRNALYGSGFENLGYIVLDECHYMGDEGRGNIFPLNLLFELGQNYVGFAIRDRRLSSDLVERAGRMALSGVPLSQCPIAYQLAANHKKESIDWGQLPFATAASPAPRSTTTATPATSAPASKATMRAPFFKTSTPWTNLR